MQDECTKAIFNELKKMLLFLIFVSKGNQDFLLNDTLPMLKDMLNLVDIWEKRIAHIEKE